jgi:hypothetical protein
LVDVWISASFWRVGVASAVWLVISRDAGASVWETVVLRGFDLAEGCRCQTLGWRWVRAVASVNAAPIT